MSKRIRVGTWVEHESRDVTQCPSYYAADHETLRTKPGEYPLFLRLIGGYTVPMPQYLETSIDAERIEGRLYSGFGGVNFASTELPHGPAPLHVSVYAYYAKQLVEEGKVKLDPGFEWLLAEVPWREGAAPQSWADVPGEWLR